MANSSKGTAVITGATGGIGAIFAERLARRGFDVLLVSRNQKRLDAIAKLLSRRVSGRVETLAADLSSADGLAGVETRLRADSRITVLVNNAGMGAVSTLLESQIPQIDQMIALNVHALTRLTHAVSPGFVKRGAGAIINIASIVGVIPELLNGVYGASKAYVIAFSRSLHAELAAQGVRVQVVLPGAIATKFWAESGKPVEELPSEFVMSPENLVDAALAGFDLGEFATVPSLPDVADWNAYEAARDALRPHLSRNEPAARYRGVTPAA